MLAAPPPIPPVAWWNWTLDKVNISNFTNLPADALHIHAGMLIMTLTALLLRRAPWTFWPWFAVCVAETANELYDLFQPYYPSDEGNIPASLHDFWMTLLWPTVIFLLFCWFHRHAIGKQNRVDEGSTTDET
jgi:hypothetical protein